jgi:hypothetical protein
MSFEGALSALRRGDHLRRKVWGGAIWVHLQIVDPHSKMGEKYIYRNNAHDKLVPYNPTPEDLFAEDWVIIRLPGASNDG